MPVFTAENWDKTKKGSKQGFDTVWGWADKLGAPVNRLTNKIGSEAFWPTTLDKEADKAARILRSFCRDGFYSEGEGIPQTEEARDLARHSKQRVIKTIPQKVIQEAKGLAIFTTMRSGLWVSGAGGSGILIARQDDGSWSPPSGILIHTAALGFVFGVDIYDCVIVINSQQALDAFKAMRATLGGELSAVAGPVGIGGVVEGDVTKLSAPVFTYMKSRGFYAGLGANGSIIIERKDENEKFYHERVGVSEILKGHVKHIPRHELKTLWTTLRAAQGDRDYSDEDFPDDRPTPGDLQLERMNDSESFGLPTVGDPDPFGVHALEQEGFEIREAGTGTKPPEEVFEYKPSESSPAYAVLKRRSLVPPPGQSGSGGSSRQSSHNRKQKMSNPWMVPYADSSTQTIGDEARDQEIAEEALRPPRSPVAVSRPVPPLPPRTQGPMTPEVFSTEQPSSPLINGNGVQNTREDGGNVLYNYGSSDEPPSMKTLEEIKKLPHSDEVGSMKTLEEIKRLPQRQPPEQSAIPMHNSPDDSTPPTPTKTSFDDTTEQENYHHTYETLDI